MRYTLLLMTPRFALLGLAGVYVYTGSPWISLFPLGAFALSLGCPKVGA